MPKNPPFPAKWPGDDPNEEERDYSVYKAPPNAPLVVKQRAAEKRRAKVAEYILRGWNNERIAEKLDVSLATVSADVDQLRVRWRERHIDSIEFSATKDLQRLDILIDAVWDKAATGDLKSIETMIKLISERGAILGYRQGITIDIESSIRAVALANGYPEDKALAIAQRISVGITL